MKANRAPQGLGPRGGAFWGQIASMYNIATANPGEVELLSEVCRMLDDIEGLRGRVAEEGLTGKAAVELRLARLALGRLMAQLNLEVGTVESPASSRARRAAEVRWMNTPVSRRRRTP